MNPPIILAIDTSCDETAVAITQGRSVLVNIIASQVQLHKQYGGVFPTVAKQAHHQNLPPSITAALKRAQLSHHQIDGIAVTQGPGLAPALEVGLEYAKQLALRHHIPLIPINHLEGHLVSVLAVPQTTIVPAVPTGDSATTNMVDLPHFSALGLIVSGGHTEFVLIHEVGHYEYLGGKIDDAAGECLDKVGRMLDLGYPAGPVVEKMAQLGDPHKYQFPLPMTTSGDYNLSFSGLKTHARNLLEKLEHTQPLTKNGVHDFCASFQYAVFRAITYKLTKILATHTFKEVWLGGGVAANMTLRQSVRATLSPNKIALRVPYTKRLCGDNAAMIGVAAGYKKESTWLTSPAAKMNVQRKPRWPVRELQTTN